ncbi:MAG TPA: DNA gyrase subunit B [Petrotogaceae bacterium]|jgi:DNA gyrase subunit B|nr:DNA gyrase subunit B [Petrotogaceae bacterium]HNY36681.1 DNA gyrase subunit B [Petrotogaceae bacterium]HOG34028.1 DNA gyrase subunit B [Petrotogaceae bacterium]HPA92695.1 DNA gyrase subunit B [Petrotogaceae bacterium]HPX16220.1 DNA gyrase subunit B [Petrotogaceae bacterium]
MLDKEYNGNEIKVLKGLEPVRLRPGMYVGSTSKAGLNHLVYEIVDNSIDEYINGYCDSIKVSILKDDVIEVIDNGRGIPVDIHPTEGKSTLEVVMTVLHAGGKFDKRAYKVSGGLHGVGASVVNALSEFMEVTVYTGSDVYYQKYQRGIPVEPVKIIDQSMLTGTKVRFKPDYQIFEDGDIEVESYTIENRLKEIAYLNPPLTIEFSDEKIGKKEVYHFSGGLEEFLEYELKKKKRNKVSSMIYINGFYTYKNDEPDMYADIEFVYTDSDENDLMSYVNNIRTIDGGEHEVGFKTAITRVMNDYARKLGMLKEKDENFTGEDVREGLNAIIHVKLANPTFEGQTKGKLGSKYAREGINQIISEKLQLYFDSHQKECKVMIERVQEATKKRLAAKRARENVKRKSVFESGSLPGKLADCISKDRAISEIFIVEGDSAGGNAKQARDRNYQAILPLRGKILNVEKTDVEKLLKSEMILNIIAAIGTGISDHFSDEDLRYGKIIIMTDADVDGAHIRTLLLTLFYRYMKKLVENGNIYVAQPPLYRFETGKQYFYLFTEKELENLKEQYKDKKYSIQRYKGLGEMSAQQLWETTMDKENRKLIQIKSEDFESANAVIDILMGEDPQARRIFIETNAHKIKELDI